MNAAAGKHAAFIGFSDWHFVRRTDSPLVKYLLYLIGARNIEKCLNKDIYN